MQQFGMEEGILEVQTAVDEACTNVIKYAYSTTGGAIAVTCEWQSNDFVVTISDKGKSFDPNSIPPPYLKSDLGSRKIGGLGIYLMKKLMDDVSYSFDPEEGNKLVMRRRLAQKT
jgi:serine/threonine-protein kinase RsbW